VNFDLDEDTREIRDLARRVAIERLRPGAFERRHAYEFPAENIKLLGDLGLLGLCLPEEYGGGGRPELDAILVIEQLGWGYPVTGARAVMAMTGPCSFIAKFGTAEQKKRYIPPVCAGEERWSISLTEPQAGSALTDMATRAEIVGDTCVINGGKTFCGAAADSDHILVFVRFGPGVSGIGAVIVHKDTPGLTLSPRHEFMSGSSWYELFFDDATVPASDVLFDGDGMRKLLSAYSLERCGTGALVLGIAQLAMDMSIEYAEQRQQFGRPISDFQMIQDKLARMYIKLESARLLTYRAIARSSNGLPSRIDSSAAKVAATVAATEVCHEALQIHGAAGMTREMPLEWLYRVVRPYQVAGGTTEIHLSMVASELVGRRFDHRHPSS
jgi:alkylation response protein AidB-like acyl-CoA dehydrogenase